jgi:hypothetical protein
MAIQDQDVNQGVGDIIMFEVWVSIALLGLWSCLEVVRLLADIAAKP